MVVENSASGCLQRMNVHSLIVDAQVGFKELTQDLREKKLQYAREGRLVILLGQADVVRGLNLGQEVYKFLSALQNQGFPQCVTITGPIPQGDKVGAVLNDMLQATVALGFSLRKWSKVTFSDIGLRLIEDRHTAHCMVTSCGLTLNGLNEIKLSIA